RIKLPEKRDTLLTYLPVENYFCSITKTYQSKGVIARAAPTPTTPNADVSEMESWEAPAGDWRRLTDSLVVRQATRRRFDLNRASSANVLRWARASVP